MALTLKATTGTASRFLAHLRYPVKRGLQGVFYMGSAEANQLTNHVPGGAALTAQGAPTVNLHSVTTNYNVGYVSGIDETEDFTYIAVAKVPAQAVGRVHLMCGIEQKPGTPVEGTSLQIDVNAAAMNVWLTTKGNGFNNYRAALPIPTVPVGAVAFFAGRACFNNHKSRCWCGYNGTLLVGADQDYSYDRSLPTGGAKIKMGGSTVPFAAGYCAGETHMIAVHSVALTDAEIANVYAFLRTKYDTEYGISTL